jgi:hypothetical protein
MLTRMSLKHVTVLAIGVLTLMHNVEEIAAIARQVNNWLVAVTAPGHVAAHQGFGAAKPRLHRVV